MADPKAPTTRDYDLKTLVLKTDEEHFDPDTVYEFSNGKDFESTDGSSESGIYG